MKKEIWCTIAAAGALAAATHAIAQDQPLDGRWEGKIQNYKYADAKPGRALVIKGSQCSYGFDTEREPQVQKVCKVDQKAGTVALEVNGTRSDVNLKLKGDELVGYFQGMMGAKLDLSMHKVP